VLPRDIAVHDILPVRQNAHARFDAVLRTYRYFIARKKDPFLMDYSWYLSRQLDTEKMNQAAKILSEYTDFTSFSKLRTQVKTNTCRIIHSEWATIGNFLVFTITADRFLRGMVRAIVGTMIELGKEKITMADFRRIIESKNRSDAGSSVPACGLYLEKVEYKQEIFLPQNSFKISTSQA
jgi:tRNA pseudouridine38-40 synthase